MSPPISKTTEHRKILKDRVSYCLDAANASYGNILDIPNVCEILVNFEYMKERWWATATRDPSARLFKNVISFNPQHVGDNINLYVDEVIPHELSHIICFSNDLDNGHGRNWKNLCREMGGNGKKLL